MAFEASCAIVQSVLEEYLRAFLDRWDPEVLGQPFAGAASRREDAVRIRLADRLSAGGAGGAARWARAVRLRSVFERIEGAPGPPASYGFRPLDRARETLFPDDQRGEDAPESELRELAQGLRKTLTDAIAYARGHPEAGVAGLLGAMARWVWCVPASSEEALRDVSLYDHSRSAAAVAAVLAEAPEEDLARWEQAFEGKADGPPIASLIHGDVSGIQDFLYRVSGKGTARGLRGRSLYLQLLAEAVAFFVLRHLELPLSNLLYSGGGHFEILARPSDLERLPAIRREVDRRLIAFHGTDLGLILEGAPVHPADLRPGGLASPLTELRSRIAKAKSRRFRELPPEDWVERLLATAPPPVEPGEWTDCSICGQVGRKGGEIEEVAPDLRKCARCRTFERLGNQALDMAAIAWLHRKDAPLPEASRPVAGWADALAAFGVQPVLLNSQGRPIGLDGLPDFEWALVWAIDSRAWEPAFQQRIADLLEGRPLAFVPRFVLRYAPRVTKEDVREFGDRYEARGEEPPEEGSVRDFEILEERSRGIARLGVLRADLDDAGRLFGEGPSASMTLARRMALSSAIARFFEGYVEELCRRRDQAFQRGGSGVIYALYSGGDDLFVVGAWDAVVELAVALREELGAYTGRHPRIALSAGLTLHGGRESARRMAEAAGEAVEMAKGYADPARSRFKDAFAFLDTVMPWKPGEAFHEIREWARRFAEAVEETEQEGRGAGRGRSLLFALIRWSLRVRRERMQRAPGDRRALIGPWLWQFSYFLRRWMDQAPEGSAMRRLLEALKAEWEGRDLPGQAERIEAIWGPAARWAELLTRRSS